MKRDSRFIYRDIWLAANSLPHPCEWCGEPVTTLVGRGPLDGIIHHVDEDRSNNSLENLRCGHLKCHTSYHQKGKPESDEHKAKMRAPRRPLSAATKAKISAARKGQRLSAETKAKISAARKSGNTNRKKK